MPHEEQAAQIRALCERAALSPDEMADRAAVKRDSMRKIINGYQPASTQLMQTFRIIAESEEKQRNQIAHDPNFKFDERVLLRVIKKLEELARANPAGFNAVADVIELYVREARRSGHHILPGDRRYPEQKSHDVTLNDDKSSSTEAETYEKAADDAVETLAEERARRGRVLSSQADAPGAKKYPPTRGTASRSSARRSSPGEVPKSHAVEAGGKGHKK